MCDGDLETRVVIKYFCKKEMPPKEIYEAFLEALGKESPSYSTVKKLAAEFKGGGVWSAEDDGRSDCPKDSTTDENVKVVHTLVMCDRRRGLRSIASDMGISLGAINLI